MTAPILAAVVKGPKPEIQANIIRRLERALVEARAGELEGGMVIFERADAEEFDYSLLGTMSLTRTLGMLELLKHKLIEHHDTLDSEGR